MSYLQYAGEDTACLDSELPVIYTTNKYASPSEWDHIRPLIKRLYVDEDKTLAEVMTIMARDHGHYGTKKMYKSRISKWNFDKNTKEPEARAVLRKKLQRNAVGKDSAFRIRGKTFTVEDALRYFKRKGILVPDTEVSASSMSTPPAIECWTPVPSPTPQPSTVESFQEDSLMGGTDMTLTPASMIDSVPESTTSDSSSTREAVQVYLTVNQIQEIISSNPRIQSFEIPYSPLPPQAYVVCEKLFTSIRAYYSGAFDNGIFETDDRGYLINVKHGDTDSELSDFEDMCDAGIAFMQIGAYSEGRRCLSKASGLVMGAVKKQHPETLDYLLDEFLRLRARGYSDIASQLRSLVHGTVMTFYPESHPWRQLISQIAVLEESYFELAILEAWRCCYDMFVRLLGEFHLTTLGTYIDYINRLPNLDTGATFKLLHSLLIRGGQEFGENDTRLFHLKYAYGRALHFRQQNLAATQIFEEILDRCWAVNIERGIIINTLDLLALCLYEMRNEYAAVERLQEAIALNVSEFGRFDSNSLRMKTQLEKWLRNLDRQREADVVRVEIEEILGPDDIELYESDSEGL